MRSRYSTTQQSSRTRLAFHIWRQFGRPLFVLLVVVWTIRLTFADWRDVPTESMAPTIHPGDRILVNLIAYDFKVPFTTDVIGQWNRPRRGDVVVFRSEDGIRTMVKRVIALPGEVVEVRDQVVYINDVPANYEWNVPVWHDEAGAHMVRGLESFGGPAHPVAFDPDKPNYVRFHRQRVPMGHYFLLGDNRDHSRDSRAIGFVAQNRIVGKVYAVAFSMETDGGLTFRRDRWFRSVH